MIQKSKKVQSATNVSTSEDQAMEISDKKKSVEEPANDVYFITMFEKWAKGFLY